jgi:RNA polymerase sigma factor (sigma-70 family)
VPGNNASGGPDWGRAEPISGAAASPQVLPRHRTRRGENSEDGSAVDLQLAQSPECARRRETPSGEGFSWSVRLWVSDKTTCIVTTDEERRERFGQVMAEFAQPVRRLCAAYTGRAADQDDLFQEIFLAVWRALPAFRGDASARTWLYRIAHNVALTWRGRRVRQDSREAPLIEDGSSCAEMDLRRLDLKRAVSRLSPSDRTLILLWLEGLSAAETEDVTGIRASTVAVRLSRIRRALQSTEAKP